MPTVATDHLLIDHADFGPANGPVVLLLHGWSDDASTWDAVAPRLADASLRVIVPTLRGFGRTRFVSAEEPRTGGSAVLALDAIALMDALGVERFMVAGHDWGSNATEALAVGWPERVARMAMLSTPPRLGGMPTPPFEQAQRQWYHWFMATARGARAVRDDPSDFAHIHGVNWSPPRCTDDAPTSVAEVAKGGSLRLYPDAKWNSWRNAHANEMPVGDYFVCAQSIVPDGHGNLWVFDPGAPGNEKILEGAPKLVRIDLASNRVTKVIPVPGDVALQGTYLNDIRFSPDGKTGYITDSGTRGAIIVIDLETGESHRALDGHPSTQIDKTVTVTLDGKKLARPDRRQPAFAVDGIAISNDGRTLYYQALTGKTLYSINTATLRGGVSEADRGAAVRMVAQTHVADGLWMSKAGVLYLTSRGDYSIRRLNGSNVE